MNRSLAARVSLCISLAAGLFGAGTALFAGEAPGAKAPTVGFATRRARSARLSDYRAVGPVAPRANREIPNEVMPKKSAAARSTSDPAVQRQFGLSQPSPQTQFEGASDQDNADVNGNLIVPPDTEGDVGPNHYIQYVNNVAVIYDKTGNIVLGPFAGNAFWAGLGGPCEIQNDGDPLVRYDRMADRWVFSQFALPNFPDGPFYQCFAVSVSNDPTGEYYQYEFKTSDTFFTDYGKLGIWPDAYYMSFNMFGPSDAFLGGAYAFDRAAMLVGDPAGMIAFDTGQEGGVLPSDLDGATPPPAGSPNFFMTFELGPARLLEWQFHVDWTTPENSTFTGPIDIPAAEFIYPVCEAPRGQCVPQLGSAEKLEALQEKLMYRLAYRNFGDHESLVVNHTVGTDAGASAVRWYEIRSPGDAPAIYQQGTFAPDASYRWMGSIAMDRNGDIALGYSKSSPSMHPAIAITGRLAGDPLGLMGAEDVWFAGAGSQTDSSSRWGDYSTMSIDPVDDCTFWYTQEYYASTGGFDFQTRIGAFRFPSCTSGAAGTLQGTVTATSGPLAGATVTAAPSDLRPAGAGDSSTTTDASGHYQFLTLPAGSYAVTASKFGYASATAGGVVVSDGGNTTQDFELAASQSVFVNGVVRDGSGQDWPLYAKIVVTGPVGFPGVTVFTDPVTGYYSLTLVGAADYELHVSAVASGYAAGGGPLSLPAAAANVPGGIVANWSLPAVAPCTAQGYAPGGFTGAPILSEGFDAGTVPPGWSVDTVSGVSWQVASGADPCGQFEDNRTGGTGPYAILNSGCFSVFTTDDSSLVTPPMDLSSRTNVAIQWANDFVDLDSGTVAGVDVSADGGTTWTNVWTAPRPDLPGPGDPLADMTLAAGHSNVRARFHYQGFWAWWWQVDNVEVGSFACTPLPGGLVVGTVTDANTGLGLNGATVQNTAGGDPVTTFATPEDPAQGDGLYILFSESGAQSFEAAFAAHEPATKPKTVIPNSASRLDFSLAAGFLEASPRPLSLTMSPGGSQTLSLNLTNTGTGTASFLIEELNVPPSAFAPARPVSIANAAQRKAALKRIPFGRMNGADTRGLAQVPGAPANAPTSAGGNVVATFPTGLAAGWGLAYDSRAERLWISDPDAADFGHPGDGFEHQYTADGTPTDETIDIHATGGLWQAEGTYNGRTGMLWEVNVGGDMCLFEMDPVAKAVTGRKICGPWSSSQRAVAYDYATDTYFVGGTNDATVYHVDGSGTLLDSAYVGLGISGLAYNPSTRHLFIASEFPSPFNVWVVDPSNAYAIRSGFLVTSGGAPALPNSMASLEADCGGHLRAVDPDTQTVYEFESGESGWCADDIPWLSEDPTAGTVAAGGGTLPVAVTFDSTGLLPGLRLGSLLFSTDTPDPVAPVPVVFTVLFGDVAEGSFAWNYIYAAAGAGVMPGCAPQTPTFLFCPAEVVTRRTMAGFIERAVHGAMTPPPVYLDEFADVLAGSFNANYIQGLVDDQITAGCGGGNYCPDVPVTRAQMAVFVWKGQHATQAPPACTPPGTFADVPCPGGFAVDYVEGIASEGITAGCGNGNYCPNATITNAQMAVFLVKAFQIPYLP